MTTTERAREIVQRCGHVGGPLATWLTAMRVAPGACIACIAAALEEAALEEEKTNQECIRLADERDHERQRRERVEGAIELALGTMPHLPMCGCDHEQNDPACHVGIIRAALADTDA